MPSKLFKVLVCAACLSAPLAAQPRRALPAAAERPGTQSFSFMDGIWVGQAWTITPQGRLTIAQTERVGPMLDGAVRVVEGAGYLPNGARVFHALGIISYDAPSNSYRINSHAQGQAGTFTLTRTADGYRWETPAGAGAVIRYTARFSITTPFLRGRTAAEAEHTWHEYGERITSDGTNVRIFEMRLTKVDDTSWPSGNPVPPTFAPVQDAR